MCQIFSDFLEDGKMPQKGAIIEISWLLPLQFNVHHDYTKTTSIFDCLFDLYHLFVFKFDFQFHFHWAAPSRNSSRKKSSAVARCERIATGLTSATPRSPDLLIESLLQLKLEARIEAVKTVYYQLQQVYGISAVERNIGQQEVLE